jgi:hypothetical protein
MTVGLSVSVFAFAFSILEISFGFDSTGAAGWRAAYRHVL